MPEANSITKIEVRAYFADTDASGMVHHANYVKWFEQARTKWIHERGFSLDDWQTNGVIFVVKSLTVNYKMPVRIDQKVTITSELTKMRNASLTFEQQILHDSKVCCHANIKLVCVGLDDSKPRQIPAALMP